MKNPVGINSGGKMVICSYLKTLNKSFLNISQNSTIERPSIREIVEKHSRIILNWQRKERQDRNSLEAITIAGIESIANTPNIMISNIDQK